MRGGAAAGELAVGSGGNAGLGLLPLEFNRGDDKEEDSGEGGGIAKGEVAAVEKVEEFPPGGFGRCTGFMGRRRGQVGAAAPFDQHVLDLVFGQGEGTGQGDAGQILQKFDRLSKRVYFPGDLLVGRHGVFNALAFLNGDITVDICRDQLFID